MTRVAVLTLGDAKNRKYYSGTSFYAHRELKRRFPDLHLIETNALDKFMSQANRVLRRIGLDVGREPLMTWAYNRAVRHQLQKVDPDVIVSVGASHKIAGLDARWPLIHISDALFGTVARYYRRYGKLSPRTLTLGHQLQQRALDGADMMLLTSQWAVEDALATYSVDSARLKIVPIGANFDAPPDRSAAETLPETLKILFVGVEWDRKGGPLALAAFKKIRQQIPEATLDIVGCVPNEASSEPGVVTHGYLRKAEPQERDRLERIYRSAAIFLMPSHEEAFGLVFCEAAAYGLVAVALRTGGVPTIVVDGQTGLLFEEDAKAQDIADGIVRTWNDTALYEKMRLAARERYETLLNWTSWGAKVADEIIRLAKERRQN